MNSATKAAFADSTVTFEDRPVFDIANDDSSYLRPLDRRGGGEWSPSGRPAKSVVSVLSRGDGPTVEHRLLAQAAWVTSRRYSGQHANDNQDWPLAKLLKTEGNVFARQLADRYREMYDAANDPADLIGRDIADDIYLVHRMDLDPSTGDLADKGQKTVTGKKARVDTPSTRSVAADPDKTKRRAKPIPRKWNGDWPLLNRIDAGRDLAKAQAALGWLREAFEAAVVGGETLEAIGHQHGVGNSTGAKGAGRALVFLGFQALDDHWQRQRRTSP